MQSMRTVHLVLLFALTGAVHAAGAQDAPATAASSNATMAAAVIQPQAQCLDPTTIARWDRLDAHRVAVTTRENTYFLLEFAAGCSASRDRPSAWQMSTQAPARLCGYPDETAISSSGDICAIAGIRRLDKKQLDALIHGGSG